MRFFATILDILNAGLDGDPQKARGYGELLVQRVSTEEGLSDEGRLRVIAALRRVLDFNRGDRGAVISPAQPGEDDDEEYPEYLPARLFEQPGDYNEFG